MILLFVSGCGYSISSESNSPEPTSLPSAPDLPECNYDSFDCEDFESQGLAQYVFEICYEDYGDVHHLDRDNDGIVCENFGY